MIPDLLSDLSDVADPFAHAMSPYLEMGAYEALWVQDGVTFRKLASQFRDIPDCLPSDYVPPALAEEYAAAVCRRFAEAGLDRFGVRVNGGAEFPPSLRDAANPIALLYYAGCWELAWTPLVAVVGSRKPSSEGLARTRRLARQLVADGYTVASGLAAGIDTAAHQTAIRSGGQTVAVIGTPLSSVYPKENSDLQRQIAKEFLLISQVPVRRYEQRDFRWNRAFFPERNATMSALSIATVIVEAGETSGALIQARQALQQRRKLFILDSCFRKGLAWPSKFLARGAIRVMEYEDIQRELSSPGN